MRSRDLTVRNFAAAAGQGLVNHDSGNGWTIADDMTADNPGAALMAGANGRWCGNCLRGNGQYAINAYQAGDGITNLLVDGNEIVGNDTDNWESVPTRLRLQRRREVLGRQRRHDPEQLDPRQPLRGPVGRQATATTS